MLLQHMFTSTRFSCQLGRLMGAGEWQKLARSSSLGWGRHFGACPPGAHSHLCQASACPDRRSPCQGQHRCLCASTLCTQSSFSTLMVAQTIKTLLLHVVQHHSHMLHLACLLFLCNVVKRSLLCCFSGVTSLFCLLWHLNFRSCAFNLEAIWHLQNDCAHGLQGCVHITGGGFTENLPRVMPKGLACQVQSSSWEWPPLFQWLQKVGELNLHVDSANM